MRGSCQHLRKQLLLRAGNARSLACAILFPNEKPRGGFRPSRPLPPGLGTADDSFLGWSESVQCWVCSTQAGRLRSSNAQNSDLGWSPKGVGQRATAQGRGFS